MFFASRACFSLLAFAAAFLLIVSLVLEFILGLELCPLCILQRGLFVLIGSMALAAAIHNRWCRSYGGVLFILSVLGGALAVRHLYIQAMPPELAPACIPPLSYLIAKFPITEMIYRLVSGSGDCAEVQWYFLGLSIPGWSLIWFILFGVSSLLSIFLTGMKIQKTV